jgi:hypothetical protein
MTSVPANDLNPSKAMTSRQDAERFVRPTGNTFWNFATESFSFGTSRQTNEPN